MPNIGDPVGNVIPRSDGMHAGQLRGGSYIYMAKPGMRVGRPHHHRK